MADGVSVVGCCRSIAGTCVGHLGDFLALALLFGLLLGLASGSCRVDVCGP